MHIRSIKFSNVRSFIKFECDFGENINLIYGQNGEGKTSVLEAIHTLSLAKSFRSGLRKNMVKEGEDSLNVLGKVVKSGEEKVFSYNIHKDKRKVLVDNVSVENLSELVGKFPTVVMSPEDVDVVSGTGQTRRRFIDRIISTVDKKYLSTIRKFEKIKKNRNRLFQTGKYETLNVWNEQIADTAIEIWKKRESFITEFSLKFQTFWQENFPEVKIGVEYKKQQYSSKEKYLNRLAELFETEKKLKNTLVGPHKDDINFYWNSRNVKEYCSQGEKKFLLTVVKLLEAQYIYQKTQKKPVLLLDDLFAKLDINRSKKVLSILIKNYQTIITTTDQQVEPLIKEFEEKVNFINISEHKKKWKN